MRCATCVDDPLLPKSAPGILHAQDVVPLSISAGSDAKGAFPMMVQLVFDCDRPRGERG